MSTRARLPALALVENAVVELRAANIAVEDIDTLYLTARRAENGAAERFPRFGKGRCALQLTIIEGGAIPGVTAVQPDSLK